MTTTVSLLLWLVAAMVLTLNHHPTASAASSLASNTSTEDIEKERAKRLVLREVDEIQRTMTNAEEEKDENLLLPKMGQRLRDDDIDIDIELLKSDDDGIGQRQLRRRRRRRRRRRSLRQLGRKAIFVNGSKLNAHKYRQRKRQQQRKRQRRTATTSQQQRQRRAIVGGSLVPNPNKYPFMVSSMDGCGGSLVARDVVLTAAHCLDNYGDDCLVGAFRYNENVDGIAETRQVLKRLSHPQYDPDGTGSWAWDIALVKISPSTKRKIQLIFRKNLLTDKQWLTAIGFGNIREGGSNSDELRQVSLQYVSMNDCNGRNMYKGDLHETAMLCADYPDRDTCSGDSGSPLFVPVGGVTLKNGKKNRQPIQVGVSSWGRGDCANDVWPGVFSSVVGARGWIRQNICSMTHYHPSFCPKGKNTNLPINYYLDIQYDKYPNEFSMTIRDAETDELIFVHELDESDEFQDKWRNRHRTLKLPDLVQGGRYVMEFDDTDDDGMVGNGMHGENGYVFVYAYRGLRNKRSGRFLKAIKMQWVFSDVVSVEFTVPKQLGIV